ncbi:uncharacterized protein [Lepisosteus oculatus]|uniref:uncharacterized protein n=1 Tax=Lepisosteus oculatus TaxID=7918 RepID=UPI003712168E
MSLRLARSALLNTRSVNSKALLLCYIIKEKQLDLLCLTETWHKQNDGLLFNQLIPPGYGLFDLPRLSGRGGGIIVIYNLLYSLSPTTIPPPSSFECLVLNVSIPQSTIIATVYRPPKPSGVFLGEFADFLSFLSLKFKRILILGDFNIHIDSTSSSLAKDFLSLLGCFDLTQFVCTPTHNKGHTLDLIIANDSFVSHCSPLDLSDHLAILFNLELPVSNTSPSRSVNFRNWRSIDHPRFANSVLSSLSCFSSSDPLEDKIQLLDNAFLSTLDTFAPLKTQTISFSSLFLTQHPQTNYLRA